MGERIESLKWYIKQLVPLTYDTTFYENGEHKLCIWKMFLGRCYNVRYFKLAE